MKTEIIISVLILFLGIFGVVAMKFFADNNSFLKVQMSDSKSTQNILYNVTDNGSKSSNLPTDDYTTDNYKIENYIRDYYITGNNLYSSTVFEYPDRIDIRKYYSKHEYTRDSSMPMPCRSKFYSLLIYDITKNTAENLNKYPIIRSSVMNDNIKHIVYDAVSLKGKKIELNVLFANGIYFDIGNNVLDAKKIADNTYMVIYQNIEYVKYIHTDKNSKIVSETYRLPIHIVASERQPKEAIRYPISGKILTDNIIRFEWTDGAIEHWKARLTKEDIEKNKEYGLKQGFKNTEDNTLLWWNGKGKHKLNCNAWDYNEDTGKEPTYK